MSVWDQHADFLAKDAARLATHNDLEAQGLIELMQSAYEKALNEVHLKYCLTIKRETVALQGGIGNLANLRYKCSKDPLPEDCFFSRRLFWHTLEMFDVETDEDWRRAMTDVYESWRDNKTGDTASSSSRFELQRFTRREIDRWLRLRGIQSRYSFIQESTGSSALQIESVSPIDPATLAVPQELLEVFGRWGLKKSWFDAPRKHPWLHKARKVKGTGSNKPIAPMYCPYEVMVGLRTQSRAARGRFSEEKGWEILKKHFPAAFARFEGFLTDHDQSRNHS